MPALKELEGIISRIEGVKAVKVVGEDDEVKEIHVIADDGKSPKQVVRDIETAVLALTGYKIDRKVVSVAQLAGLPQRRRRIALVDLQIEKKGLKAFAKVAIQRDGEELEGEACGPATSPQIPLIIGRAVIEAIGESEIAISVDDVQVAKVFNRDYVMAHLTCSDGKGEWEVIGIAPKGGELERASALAVIDALEKVI